LESFTAIPGFTTTDHVAYSLRINLIVADATAPSAARQSIWLDVLAHREGAAPTIDFQAVSGGADPGALGVTLVAGVAGINIVFLITNPSAFALRCVADVQWVEVSCSP